MTADKTGLLPCPFCGSEAERRTGQDMVIVRCPKCVSVGFYNHVRLGCLADARWNERAEEPKNENRN
jgi:Zn-finger nucleic acid-binding protein